MTCSRLSAFQSCIAAIVMLAILSAGCSGISSTSEYEQVKQVEASFADRIAAAGGTARKEGRSLVIGKVEGTGWFIDLSGDTITDDLIDAIITAYQSNPVFELNLRGSTITNEQLAKLDAGKVLQKVFILDLCDTAITDGGLDKCENVHCLQELRLTGSKATLDGAKRLGERKVKHASTPKMFRTAPKLQL